MTTLLADLGGTRLKWGADPEHVQVARHAGRWLPALRAAVAGVDEVALCVPGIVDGGRVVSLPGKLPGLEGADVAALLGVRVPVLVNDAVAYGLGEAAALPGRTLVVTLGTGVGVCVVEDGRVLGSGPLGGGLLSGQLPLGDGTIESHCSAGALVGRLPGAQSTDEVHERAAATDPAAAQAVSEHRAWLARALGALCLAHAPERVLVGGGAARPALVDGLQPVGLFPGQAVDVRLAAHGDAAALRGLQALLRSRVAA